MKLLSLVLQLLPLLALAEEQNQGNLRKAPSVNRDLINLNQFNGAGKGKGQAVVVDDDCYGWQQGYDMGKGKGYTVCDDPTAEPTHEPTTGKGLNFDDVDDPAVNNWVNPTDGGKGKGWVGGKGKGKGKGGRR